jgi:RNA polymerase sigma factor (sigma-70 family)
VTEAQRGRLGDESERFEQLFRRHAAQLQRFFLRRTGDWAASEDLCSMVFCEAWRRRHEVDLETRAPLPWLYGVAANVLRNHVRARRRRDAALIRVPHPVAPADATDDIAERLAVRELARTLAQAISALPPGERDVVALCMTRGYSYRAAASTLGLPVGTIRSRLFRARARLSEQCQLPL